MTQEHRTRLLNWLGILLYGALFAGLGAIVTGFFWAASNTLKDSCGWLKATYWTVQTFTTVGYGSGFSEFNEEQLQLCITWMIVSALSWGSLANLLFIKLSHRFGE